MKNVQIKEVAVYHPENTITNEFYLDHFKKVKDKDISNFLNIMGRESRYIIDNNIENSQTMAIEAAKRVLKKANLTGKDLQLIVFSTQTPETTFPTNAIFLHHAIEAATHTIAIDSNANCAGMTVAIEQASRYMQANPHVERALVVGADYNSLLSNPNDEITYANYGDAAAAIILEKTEEDRGFIDALFHVDTSQRDFIRYPAEGLSKTLKEGTQGQYIQWAQFDGAKCLPPAYDLIQNLLDRNGLTAQDINLYSFSQFALVNIKRIQEHFTISDQQIVYVGDKYGYTGTSSPVITLYEAIEAGQVKRGDYILFWTIGAGYEQVAMLFKY